MTEDAGVECRFCMETDDPEQMIVPCKCSGSAKYIHRQCLDQWRLVDVNTINSYRCGTCHFFYRLQGDEKNANKRSTYKQAVNNELQLLVAVIVLLFLLCLLVMFLVCDSGLKAIGYSIVLLLGLIAFATLAASFCYRGDRILPSGDYEDVDEINLYLDIVYIIAVWLFIYAAMLGFSLLAVLVYSAILGVLCVVLLGNLYLKIKSKKIRKEIWSAPTDIRPVYDYRGKENELAGEDNRVFANTDLGRIPQSLIDELGLSFVLLDEAHSVVGMVREE